MAKKREPLPLEANDLPSLFRLADRGASRSKRNHFLLVGGELACISLAAIAKIFGQRFAPDIVHIFHIRIQEVPFQGSSVSGKDLTDTIASFALPTLFLVLAGAMYLARLVKRYDAFWRAQRALAEAIRELAWQFSMRVMPADLRAPAPLDQDASKKAFQVEFKKLKQQGNSLQLGIPTGPEITDHMKSMRDKGAVEQRDAYLRGRLSEAQQWYATRANRYRVWMWVFQGARIAAYGLGGILIFVNAFGSYGLGAMTTIAGALGTWLVVRHYDDLSQSYGVIAGDLNYLHDTAPSVSPETPSGGGSPGNDWAQFVVGIEALLKGERQDWLRESKIGDAPE